MSTSSPAANPYDELPYPSEPLTASQPDRLAAVGLLFGMQPPPVERSRVLEIGCSTGGNLIPMAERLRQAAFLGIDYSQVQIAAAQQAAQALNLSNVEFRQADIAQLGPELGRFDYIIIHGVYSWVRPELQEKLLALCGGLLAEQGVAFVSYNALPGWYHRMIVREVLWRCAPPGTSSVDRLARSRRVLEFLSTVLGQQPEPPGRLLKQVIDVVLKQPDHYIWHEYFADENHPLFFYEFAERLHPFGLQYLGEASFSSMFASSFGLAVDEQLAEVARDLISAEQHVDFLRNRAFRQSLICRREVPLERNLTPKRLERLCVAGQLRPASPAIDLNSETTEAFLRPDGRSVSSPSPPLKAALAYLGAQWPRAIPQDELFRGAAELLGRNATAPLHPDERENVGHNLVQCLANGVIEPFSLPDDFVTSVSPRPQTSRLALWQARHAATVTNRRHESVTLDEATRRVLAHLDGEHDHAALLEILIAAADCGELSILVDGLPAMRGQQVSQALEQSLHRSLAFLACHALLVA